MTTTTSASFLQELEACISREGPTDAGLNDALKKILTRFDCAAGTLHDLDPSTGLLRLRAAQAIPPHILEKVRTIPIGKGMGGLAAQRRQPVQVCNLQTDTSGVAKASAKETRMEGSIAVPMLHADQLHGVLGIAKPVAYEFAQEEISFLEQIGSTLARLLAQR